MSLEWQVVVIALVAIFLRLVVMGNDLDVVQDGDNYLVATEAKDLDQC